MKNIVYIILILIFYSCQILENENGLEFSIENKSDFTIKNIKFTTSEKLPVLNFKEIKPDGKVSNFLNMQNNKHDGSYVLTFTQENGKTVSKGFGYYTNGGSLDKRAKFVIKNDTVISKFSGPVY